MERENKQLKEGQDGKVSKLIKSQLFSLPHGHGHTHTHVLNLISAISKCCSLSLFHLSIITRQPPLHLSLLKCHHKCRAFSLARCNVFHSSLLSRRYNKILYSERQCVCESGMVESLSHMILHSNLYSIACNKFLVPYVRKQANCSDGILLMKLLITEVTTLIETMGILKYLL